MAQRLRILLVIVVALAMMLAATPAQARYMPRAGWNVECKNELGNVVDPFSWQWFSVQCVSLHVIQETSTGMRIDFAQVQWFIKPDHCFGTPSMCGYDGTDAQNYTCYRATLTLTKNSTEIRSDPKNRLCPHTNTRVISQWNLGGGNHGEGSVFRGVVKGVPPMDSYPALIVT